MTEPALGLHVECTNKFCCRAHTWRFSRANVLCQRVCVVFIAYYAHLTKSRTRTRSAGQRTTCGILYRPTFQWSFTLLEYRSVLQPHAPAPPQPVVAIIFTRFISDLHSSHPHSNTSAPPSPLCTHTRTRRLVYSGWLFTFAEKTSWPIRGPKAHP